MANLEAIMAIPARICLRSYVIAALRFQSIKITVDITTEKGKLPDNVTDADEEERIIQEVQAWVDAHEQSRKISDLA